MPNPSQSIDAAITAYANPSKTGGSEGVKARDGAPQGDFAGLVKDAVQEAVKIGERSEQLSVQGIADQADLSQVITAVAEAEVTLQTVVAVRDRVIEAYRDIVRMPM